MQHQENENTSYLVVQICSTNLILGISVLSESFSLSLILLMFYILLGWVIITRKGDDYKIKTIISIWGSKFTYVYTIERNIIRFPFSSNNYWSILWRGGSKTLAEAMYKAAKKINKNLLYGRTIGGLNTELQLHYAAYVLGIAKEHSKIVDMGATRRGRSDYDSNAWFFENANAAKIAAKFCIWKP